MPEPDPTELVIVGAGPVGLYAAYYAGFRGLRWVILESLPFVGGQIATFYADSAVYDVPGFQEVRAGELVERLEAQARQFPGEIRLGVRVTGLERFGETLRVAASAEEDGATLVPIDARAVVLTTGIGRFAPQPIPTPEIDSWNGRGLSYSAPSMAGLTGRRALVAGGTPRGVELAVELASAGVETTLVHRRDKLAVPTRLRERLEVSSATFRPYRELAALEGGDRVERAVLVDRRDQSTEVIETDAVFPCFGYAAHRDPIEGMPLVHEDGSIQVDSCMAAAPGIWAAGDAANYPGKVRLLASDFGEACTAINNLTTQILPGAPLFPGYSSHRQGAARRPK